MPEATMPEELIEHLTPDPESVGMARRLVSATLSAAGNDDAVDVTVLLVSEVVTNAVLHAGTTIRLRCTAAATGARVEIFDRSPLVPSIRHYDAEAMTGRGLALVAALADAWGIEPGDGGKTVWFEVGRPPEADAPPPPSRPVPEVSPPPGLVVDLLDAPPALLRATIEQGDTLLRELALLSMAGEVDDLFPGGWHLPQFDVLPILDAADSAEAAGLARADLRLVLPAGADTVATDRLRLIDHADSLARENLLLTAPALPEIAVCRHWLYSQISEQGAGFDAQPWELPEPLEPAQAAAQLQADELDRLRAATAAVVVADDANRIIFVNGAAGDLLGWDPGALVGQRLTVLVPPELREAHLAGFSRLQTTRVPRILGRTVLVPARRHDGTCVEVALRIEQVAGHGGRAAFRALLVPAEQSESLAAIEM